MEEFKKKNKNIIFEQDGATCHTSKANQKLLNYVFGEKDGFKILQVPQIWLIQLKQYGQS